ncbi:hypothetical protein VF21_07497 [Pseudogymnoascus sp. 05NY08]|nr:hypothetical protein VF21_07497 [Pseudogymnoascus sp. 05NY08]
MKSFNLALTVTAVCGFLVSAAPAAVCEDGLVPIEGGSQHMARCVPIQAFRQVSVKEDNEEANVIEPRGGHKDDHDDECRDHKDRDDCKRRKKDKHRKKKGKKDKHRKKKGKKEKCEKEPKHPDCHHEDDHEDHRDDCHEDSKEERCRHRNEQHDDRHGDRRKGGRKGHHEGHHDDDCPEEFRGGPNCPWFRHEGKHDECEREPHHPHCKDKKEHH